MDLRAQTLIASTMDSDKTVLIMNCKTSNEMFDKIKTLHDDRSEYRKQLLYTRYYSYLASPEQSLVVTYVDISKMVSNLQDLSEIFRYRVPSRE